MPELAGSDLAAFTNDRIEGDIADDVVAAALVAARRYCGWRVSPVATEEIVVDGPGGRVLSLPTLNLLAVTEMTEDGRAVDVAKLDISRRKGTVEKHPFGYWTCRHGGITVKIMHGYTEAEAADWRRAVLRLADLMYRDETFKGDGSDRDTGDMVRKRIDDVDYQWSDKIITSDERLSAMFSQFRILPAP
jgi:hypothetical protein